MVAKKKTHFERLVEELMEPRPTPRPISLQELGQIRLRPNERIHRFVWRKIDESIRARKRANSGSKMLICPLPKG